MPLAAASSALRIVWLWFSCGVLMHHVIPRVNIPFARFDKKRHGAGRRMPALLPHRMRDEKARAFKLTPAHNWVASRSSAGGSVHPADAMTPANLQGR